LYFYHLLKAVIRNVLSFPHIAYAYANTAGQELFLRNSIKISFPDFLNNFGIQEIFF